MRIGHFFFNSGSQESAADRASATRSSLLTIVILSMALNACARREYKVTDHEDSKPVETISIQGEGQQEASARLSAPELTGTTLIERAKALFTERRLLNPEESQSSQTAQELGRINRSVLALLQNPSSSETQSEVQPVLAAYKKALFLGCGAHDLKGCQSFRIFQRDPDSLGVVLALAKRESDLTESYRLLQMAYTLQGHNGAPELDGAYLTHALSYYAKLTPGSAQAREHLELVQQILNRLNRPDEKVFDPSWLQEFDPWNFQRVHKPEMAQIDELALQLALRSGIYQDRATGKLTATFEKTLQQVSNGPSGLLAKLQNVRKQRPELLAGLGVDAAPVQDEYFFIFEGLFTGKINTTEASVIWQATRQDVPTAQKELLHYLRLRLATLTHESNYALQSFLASKGQFTSGSVITAAFEYGHNLTQLWAAGLGRFGSLRTIADRHLRNGTQSTDDLDYFFAGLNRNVKFLATYPNMFIVAYHMARLNFSTRRYIGSVELNLDAATVFQGLFDGKLIPMFDFSPDLQPLSAPEILLAFQFALKTGAFEGAGITLEDFFKVLIEKMISVDNEDLKRAITGVQQQFEGDHFAREFRQLCAQTKNVPRGGLLASPQMPLDSLQNYGYLGIPSRSQVTTSQSNTAAPVLQAAWQFYEFEKRTMKRTPQLVEQATYAFAPRVGFIRLLVDLLQTHLKESSASGADQLIAKINQNLAPFERTKLIANTTLLRYHRAYSACLDRVTWAEMDTRTFLVQSFVQHLREVHAAMLAEPTSSANTLDGRFNLSRQGVSMAGLAEHESSLGFSKTMYRFSKLQLFLRFKGALEEGFNSADGHQQPMRQVGSFLVPDSIDQVSTETRATTVAIPFSSDVDTFVSSGLRALLGSNQLINWPNDDTLLGGLTLRLETMRNLAKSGDLDVCDPSNAGCTSSVKDRLTMKELVNTQIESLRMIELDATWTQFLQAAGVANRFGVKRPAYTLDLVTDSLGLSVYGLLDSTFRSLYLRISANTEGAPADAKSKVKDERFDPLDEAEQYFTAMQSMGRSSFEVSPQYNQLLAAFYGRASNQALIRTAEFVREAQALEKNGTDLPNWNHYVTRRYPEKIPVLSPGLAQEFRARALQFSRLTKQELPAEVLSATQGQD